MSIIKPFKNKITITRPLVPDLDFFCRKISVSFKKGVLTNNGPYVVALTEKLKKYLDVPSVSLMANATVALGLAHKAFGLSGEVITTPFTFVASSSSLVQSGLIPVFCDIDPDTLNIDTSKVANLISKNTSAILPVHVFGNPCDIELLDKQARGSKIKIIYDAAHAFGVKYKGVGIGNFGNASIFSFHATKLFNTAEGGAITTKDSAMGEKFDFLRNFGFKNPEEVVGIGTNAKMNELEAVCGLAVLGQVGQEIKKREIVYNLYKKNLGTIPGISFMKISDNTNYNFHYMPILINEDEYGMSRDLLFLKLKDYNVLARKYFFPLITEMKIYKIFKKTSLPVAEKVAKEVMCLPLHGSLSLEVVEKICYIIEKTRRKKYGN